VIRQKRIAAEAEGDEQAVHAAAPLTIRIEPQPEEAEVDLGRLARGRLGHADGHGGGAEAEVRPREAMQGAVRHSDAVGAQATVDLRQPQAFAEPGGDLLAMRRQPVGYLPGPTAPEGADGGEHGHHVRVRRPGRPSVQAGGHRRGHVLGDRLAIAPRPARDRAQTFPQAEPPQDLANLDHTQLPVGHDHLLGRG
jgi:hypothetical protein